MFTTYCRLHRLVSVGAKDIFYSFARVAIRASFVAVLVSISGYGTCFHLPCYCLDSPFPVPPHQCLGGGGVLNPLQANVEYYGLLWLPALSSVFPCWPASLPKTALHASTFLCGEKVRDLPSSHHARLSPCYGLGPRRSQRLLAMARALMLFSRAYNWSTSATV